MILCIQHRVRNAASLQQGGNVFTLLNGDGAHQHRLSLFMAGNNLLNNCMVLARVIFIHHVRVIQTNHRLIGGNFDNIQTVNCLEFLCLCGSSARHTGQLVIKAEVILEGNGGKGLVLFLNIHMLLRLDRLVKALRIPSAQHQTTGKFIHDDDLAVFHDIIDIAFHDTVSLQRLIDMVAEGSVFDIRQILQPEGLLRFRDAAGGQCGGFRFFIHHIVGIQIFLFFFLLVYGSIDNLLQPVDKLVRQPVKICALVTLPGNNKRCTRFINQDRVHLVDDGKAVTALHHIFFIQRHIITKIIKAHLVICAVSDVAEIGILALGRIEIMHDQSDREPKETMDLSHPFTVTPGQIIIYGYDVYALSCQRVEISRQNCHQRFAFTGLHFCDTALMQHNTADHLHIERLHTQHTPGSLSCSGKSLREKIIQRLPCCKAIFEFSGFGTELFICQCSILLFQRHDGFGNRMELFQFTIRITSEYFIKKSHNTVSSLI